MTSTSRFIAASGFVLLVCGTTIAQEVIQSSASSPGMRMQSAEVSVRAKVVELDMARRTVTLRSTQGEIVTIEVPDSVKNFDQTRLGDTLVVRYRAAVLARLEPASSHAVRERIESLAVASAPKGALPGAAATRTVTVLAVVTAIDKKAGTVTLRGAKRTVTAQATDDVDITRIKVGEEVRAAFVESLVLNVERANP
jgi:hypothetical protein